MRSLPGAKYSSDEGRGPSRERERPDVAQRWMVPQAVFTAPKDVLKASHKPTLPKMRLGRYEKASWGTAYFLRYISLTSSKIVFYGKAFTTDTR
jgi:hypothetical protein